MIDGVAHSEEADHRFREVMPSRLTCGHEGPNDDRANYLWCSTCRCWVHVEKGRMCAWGD